MTVFVDDFRVPATVGRVRGRWSHLSADSLGELVGFAESIGLKRSWLQDKGDGRWHFDVTDTKRAEAIAAGAVAVELRWFGAWISARRRLEDDLELLPAMVCGMCSEGRPVAVRPAGTQLADAWRLCDECCTGWDYQASLSPAERRAEEESIARHVDEWAGRPNG